MIENLKRDADISNEMKSRYIEYLADEVHRANQDREAMKLVLEDFRAEMLELSKSLSVVNRELSDRDSLISEMKKQQADIMAELKKSKRKAVDLAAQLKYANLNQFGPTKHSTKKDEDQDTKHPDREKEKEDYNGKKEPFSNKLDDRARQESGRG